MFQVSLIGLPTSSLADSENGEMDLKTSIRGRALGQGKQGLPGHAGGCGLTLTRSLHPQDVFLKIQCHKTPILTDTKESSTTFELKRMVESILKRPPEDQLL